MEYYTTRNNETGQEKMVVIFSTGAIRAVERSHPKFTEIKSLLDRDRDAEDEATSLIDSLEQELNEHLISLTERISVANGHLVVDGDIVDNALSQHIMQMLDSGDQEYLSVVRFYENLLQNPDPVAREGLYGWLTAVGMFALDENGYVLGYKGVTHDGKSRNSGRAYINGELHRGRIPYPLGAVATMPRAEVEADPNNACAPGLHIGTWDYARGWGDKVIKVVFNPRDAVAVPHRETSKLRVCRFVVQEEIEVPHDKTSFRGGDHSYLDDDEYGDGYYDDDDYDE